MAFLLPPSRTHTIIATWSRPVRRGDALYAYWHARRTRRESSQGLHRNLLSHDLKSPRISSNSSRAAQVFDDLGGDDVGVFEVRRVFQAVVLEPEDVQAHLVALEQVFVTDRASVELDETEESETSSSREDAGSPS